MATYSEIYDLFSNTDLRNKVEVAVIIAADTIRSEADTTPNHTERLRFANLAWNSSRNTANSMLKAVLAANNGLTVSQLQGAADSAIQTAVENAIDIFALQIPAPT